MLNPYLEEKVAALRRADLQHEAAMRARAAELRDVARAQQGGRRPTLFELLRALRPRRCRPATESST